MKDGTTVVMNQRNNSPRDLKQIFDEFTVNEGFSKTMIPVKLAQYGNDALVSRSQARRLLAGLDKLEAVILDFRDVTFIGQAFADEVFRVFASQHPEIYIGFANACDDILNMIKHVTPRRV